MGGFSFRAVLVSSISLAAASACSHAAINAYDGFDSYTTLSGGAAGTGWDSNWTAHSSASLVPGNALSAVGPVSPGANAVRFLTSSSDSALGRNLPTVAPADYGKPVYFSFLLQVPNSGDNAFFQAQLAGSKGVGDSNHTLSIIVSDEKLTARVGKSGTGSGQTTPSTTTLTAGQTYLLVGKVSDDINTGDAANEYDRIDVWAFSGSSIPAIAPEPIVSASHVAPEIAAITRFNVRTANMDNAESFLFDEIRIGETWSSVVPEPGAVALVGLGALTGLWRRRRDA